MEKNTTAEVTHISTQGLWVLVLEKEYFLSFKAFPWFRKATIDQIHHVELHHEHHLIWPDLDIDLEVESLENLEQYPLVFKS